MRIARELPEDRSLAPVGEALSEAPPLTPESIREVRDFTARKTLEQAHAFVAGLLALAESAETDADDRALLDDLTAVGVTRRDATLVTLEAAALMKLMADRDRKAEIFHEAVKEAGQRERAVFEHLAALGRIVRARVGGHSPALDRLGIAPEPCVDSHVRPRLSREGKAPAAIFK